MAYLGRLSILGRELSQCVVGFRRKGQGDLSIDKIARSVPSPCGLRNPHKKMKGTMKCDLLVALTKQKRPHRAFTNSLPEIFLRVFMWYSFLSDQCTYLYGHCTLQRR
ncbi:Uncharacterised protein [Serratia fonticola]|nr:Uncharacterised protein [Serratia fonticola]CAI1738702.1 Uncharacterised protein [Serratia fonticola]